MHENIKGRIAIQSNIVKHSIFLEVDAITVSFNGYAQLLSVNVPLESIENSLIASLPKRIE